MKRVAALCLALGACQRSTPPAPQPTGEVVARVDGVTITSDMVRAAAMREGVDPRAALRALVDEALFVAEARRRGLAPAWAERDARWHARVRKYLEDMVEAPNSVSRLPREHFEAFVDARRAAVCHDGLRRSVHAVFLAAGDPRPAGRAQRLAAAEDFRRRLVTAAGERPTTADIERVAAAMGAQAPRVEALPDVDRRGGLVSGGGLVRPFVDAIWALTPDAPLSRPFETSFGAHVALLVAEQGAAGVTCDAMRPRLAAEFELSLRATASQALIERLRARAVIRVDTGALRASPPRAQR